MWYQNLTVTMVTTGDLCMGPSEAFGLAGGYCLKTSRVQLCHLQRHLLIDILGPNNN